jgi:hypothetical protein
MATTPRPKPSKTRVKKLHPVNIRMSDQMLEELRLHSIREERSVSNLAGKILLEWLDLHRHLIAE